MIRLHPVHPNDRDLLWNINQKYLYEMTMFYPDVMDAAGNLHYGHFEEYFTDPKYNEKNLAGERLWHAVTAPFKPEACRLSEEEAVLVFTTPKGVHVQFDKGTPNVV